MDVNAQLSWYNLIIQWTAVLLLIWFIKSKTQKGFKDYIEKRKNFINDSVSTAKTELESAESKNAEAEALKKQIQSEKTDIITKTKRVTNQEKTEIIEEAKIQAREIVNRSNEEIEQNKEQAREELMSEIIDLVSQASAHYVKDNVSDEAEEQLIKQALEVVRNGS